MTNFYNEPDKFYKEHSQYLDKVYNMLLKEDTSELVLAALDMLKKTRSMPEVSKRQKSVDRSVLCRETGNALFEEKDYANALKMYNLAMGSAPKQSQALLLAISNRSALFLKVGAYTAALKDIETCYAMECPPKIAAKLKLRREECQHMVFQENTRKNLLTSNTKDFVKLPDEHHPQMPYISKAVDVIIEDQVPKVVASKDIPVGSVVGVETPFASDLHMDNYQTACHYCHKSAFNLIPCDSCCETFFCSNKCKETCYNEYHNIECQLIDMIQLVLPEACFRVTFKAALKIKNMSKSWEDLIRATSNLTNKPAHNSITELYDARNIHSILHTRRDNQHFVFGQKFDSSFSVATLIHYLENIPGFFPIIISLKKEAIRAFSRIIMHLVPLYPQFIRIQNAAMIYPKIEVSCELQANFGLFSFTNKLKHACNPNLLVLGLDHRVALVATQTIKKGSELTISYLGHWCDMNYLDLRPAKMLFVKPGCQCAVCVDKWSMSSTPHEKIKFSNKQRNFLAKWVLQRVTSESGIEISRSMLNDTLKGLDLLRDKPNTAHYKEIYNKFRIWLCRWQYINGYHNYIIDSNV